MSCERSTVLGFPNLVVVEFGAITEIADVMDGYEIAIPLCPHQFSHIGLPAPIVRRSERQPPNNYGNETR